MQAFVQWLLTGAAFIPLLLGTSCITMTSGGCSDLVSSHVDMLNVVQAGAVSVMDRMVGDETSQAQYQVSGLAQNPGVTVEAAIVYRARAYFDGVAGQFQAGAIGKLGAASQMGEAMKIARSSDLSDEQKILLLRELLAPEPEAPVVSNSVDVPAKSDEPVVVDEPEPVPD